MRRTAITVALVVTVACGSLSSAQARTVRFELDGVPVGELECGQPPTHGRLRLEGKSGADGEDERSGLYDNLYVERLLATGVSEVVRDDDFTTLDEGFWSVFHYGWPTHPGPRLLYDFGNPPPCLMTAGTTYDYGGVISLESFDWSIGFDFSVDVFIENAMDFPHVANLGITGALPEIVIGVYWGQNGSSERVLRLHTPFEMVEIEQPTPGEWHRIRIYSYPDAHEIDITTPADGSHYVPCAPSVVEWTTNFGMGEVDAIEVFWRQGIESWQSLGISDNDGEHPWPNPPCDDGYYTVRVEYLPDPLIDDESQFQVGGYYVNITYPNDGQVFQPCALDEVRWTSNIDPGAGDVLEVLLRECGGVWESQGLTSNVGTFAFVDPPCDPGCYEVRVEYVDDTSASDTVTFEVDEHTLQLTRPVNGSTSRPCAPSEVRWSSSIDPGAGEVLEFFWRECGGAWESLGLSENDGVHPWPDPPCEPGCYEVRIEYVLDISVCDDVTFTVAPHYLNITRPLESRVYRPCAPSLVRWNSSVPVEEGEVILVEWRTNFSDWEVLGTSENDGALSWSSPPCDEPWYHEVRVEYLNDPSICDTVSFRVGPYEAPDAEYAVFVDFSGDAAVLEGVYPSTYPPTNFPVTAYLGVGDLNQLIGSWGLTSISFAVQLTEGMSAQTTYTNLLPGDLAIGSWETGITLTATECAQPEYGILYFARISLFYTGTPGNIRIIDHPEYWRWVLDCDDPPEVHNYCIYSDGGVGQSGPGGEPWCDPDIPMPVQEMSWGAIKAMYR